MTDHPHLPGRLADDHELRDTEHTWPVNATDVVYDSPYVAVSVDRIVGPDGAEHARAVVRPNGAVGVLAVDERDRLLLVEQYRHPVGRRLLEIPAGTLDVPGEAPVDAAARELAEEADLLADDWRPLLGLFATPGYSSEHWQVFTATGLQPVPAAERTPREAEEADMAQWWLPLEQAVDAVLEGRIGDAMTVAAIMAARVLRDR